MTEARIAFLYKAAALLPAANVNNTQEKMKSHFRMRCKEISKGHGLPQRHFSEQIMCTHCCIEWRKGTEIKVKSIKLSKRQRKRIKSQSKKSNNASKKHLLHSNEIEKICTFCKHSIKTVAPKPNKPIRTEPLQPLIQVKKKTQKFDQKVQSKNTTCDVYSNIAQVFSLKNKKNNLKSTKVVKEPKIIKNNKKKKDKFAGLCQRAVLMSAQLKQQKEKQNKLHLFLKPSS